MSYVNNDAAMMLVTQIAYLDFNGKGENVGNIVDGLLHTYGNCDKDGNWTLKPEYTDYISNAVKAQFDTAVNICNLSKTSGSGDEWREWKIADVCDDQDDTGYYGMLIDTGDGNAMIGCRGSESTDFLTGLKDWGEADIGLLDSTLTRQQGRAQKYMEKLWYQYGDQYNSFSITGHSLGGNLAEHMAITAPVAMQEKINHCISFDGPGYSDEYIERYKKQIERISSKTDHYQWSWVSSLLNPLPGVSATIIKAHDDQEVAEEDFGELKKRLYRHHTRNVEFDSEGNVQKGNESDLSKILGPISRDLENSSYLELIIKKYFAKGMGNIPTVIYLDLLLKIKSLKDIAFRIPNIMNKWDEFKKDIYYNYFAPQVSGEYEINMYSVKEIGTLLEEEAACLKSIEEKIDDIRIHMQFYSLSGSYYKSKLKCIQNGLERDREKIVKMIAVLENAIDRYCVTDRFVGELFS